jgi:hypothetical protein
MKQKHICIEKQDRIIIALGDPYQVEPIEESTNTKIYEDYVDECMNQFVPCEICSEENKIPKSEEDKV